jgi:hypothetical protein
MNALQFAFSLASGTETLPYIRLHSPGCRRYCAPSPYGKAKSDIDPWLPNLCFKFPLRVLTSSWTIFGPRPGTTLFGGDPFLAPCLGNKPRVCRLSFTAAVGSLLANGMIGYELMTNAARHAFSDGKREIRVALLRARRYSRRPWSPSSLQMFQSAELVEPRPSPAQLLNHAHDCESSLPNLADGRDSGHSKQIDMLLAKQRSVGYRFSASAIDELNKHRGAQRLSTLVALLLLLYV